MNKSKIKQEIDPPTMIDPVIIILLVVVVFLVVVKLWIAYMNDVEPPNHPVFRRTTESIDDSQIQQEMY